ncbi:hypothetical protein [Corynebacterium camporealensis]
MTFPPEHILTAFHAEASTQSRQLGAAWDNGVLVGDVVYAMAGPWASWSAKLREKLKVHGARVVRPVVASDGRYTAAGWKANQYVPGGLRGRVDEAAQLALRIDAVLADVPVPGNRDDVFARAERAAWEETGEAIVALPADVPVQVGHADVLGTTLFAAANPPTIVDVVPTAAPRPAGWSAALVIVDGLIAGFVDDAVCRRFNHVPHMDQLLLRAVAYRRHVNNLHPASKSNVRSEIERVEEMLVSRASEILAE